MGELRWFFLLVFRVGRFITGAATLSITRLVRIARGGRIVRLRFETGTDS